MTLANVALSSAGSVVTGSKTWWNGGTVKMIDGNTGTNTSTDEPPTSANWIKIDLNQTVYAQVFRVLQINNSNNQVYTYNLEYSLNNTDWTLLELHTASGYDDTWEIEPTQARYWRITPQTGGPYGWYMVEWEIWADAEYEPPTLSDCDPPTPTAAELTDWLAVLDADYVPTITTYLEEN